GLHKNFTLMVRDLVSKNFAEKNFNCKVILAPDMAFGTSMVCCGEPQYDVYALLRRDRESREEYDNTIIEQLNSTYNIRFGDWNQGERDLRSILAKGIGVVERTF